MELPKKTERAMFAPRHPTYDMCILYIFSRSSGRLLYSDKPVMWEV